METWLVESGAKRRDYSNEPARGHACRLVKRCALLRRCRADYRASPWRPAEFTFAIAFGGLPSLCTPDYAVLCGHFADSPFRFARSFSGESNRMVQTNTSLWPPDIQPTIESPREILGGQAHVLREQTRGLLTAEVRV